MKYSFSEVDDHKSVTVITLKEKGVMEREFLPLIPLHDWHDLRGSYEDITARSFYGNTSWTEDFVRITLTDEQDIPDAVGKLRSIYHNLLEMRYDNTRTRTGSVSIEGSSRTEEKTPLELFNELYTRQNGDGINQLQENYLKDLIESIWEREK